MAPTSSALAGLVLATLVTAASSFAPPPLPAAPPSAAAASGSRSGRRHRRVWLDMARITPEVGDCLSNYGVAAADHQALVDELTPLLAIAAKRELEGGGAEMEITVARGPSGLGIDVSQDNMIGGNAGQPELQIGDKVVAVDGERLNGRYLGKVLASKGDGPYVFTVERGDVAGEALESALDGLVQSLWDRCGGGGLQALELDGPMAEKAEALAATLEQSGWWEAALADGGIAAAEEMLEGFWRLCWTNDASFVTGGGTTGVGGRPLCTMLAHWQQFQAEKEPGAQTVEMVRNDNMGGTLKTSALKGDWALEESRLVEMYSRLEYGGALESTSKRDEEADMTFLGQRLRLTRTGKGFLRIYSKLSPADVSNEIRAWLDGSAEVKPRWDVGPPSGPGPEPSRIG